MTTPWVLLVVEDDPDITHLVKLKFNSQADFVVGGEATNGPDAVTSARLIAPDLIVLDNRLHGPMTGIEASALLKAAAPDCRIILFSASEGLREEAMGNPHIDAFVLKTDVRHLVARARELLSGG